MRLHLTDYHLEAARVIEVQLSAVSGQHSVKDYRIIENGETLILTKRKMQTRFGEHVKEAERLIEDTGYHRRDGELEELKGKM